MIAVTSDLRTGSRDTLTVFRIKSAYAARDLLGPVRLVVNFFRSYFWELFDDILNGTLFRIRQARRYWTVLPAFAGCGPAAFCQNGLHDAKNLGKVVTSPEHVWTAKPKQEKQENDFFLSFFVVEKLLV